MPVGLLGLWNRQMSSRLVGVVSIVGGIGAGSCCVCCGEQRRGRQCWPRRRRRNREFAVYRLAGGPVADHTGPLEESAKRNGIKMYFSEH